MEWRNFSDEETRDFLQTIRHPAFEGLFSESSVRIAEKPLPFFRDTAHIALENTSIAPPLALDYLWHKNIILYLDGSDSAIRRLCEEGALILTQATALSYLEFHCRAVIERPDDILLLKNAIEMRLFSDPVHYLDFHFDKNNYTDQDITLLENHKSGGFTVRAPFVFNGKIDPATAHISEDGHVVINRREGA